MKYTYLLLFIVAMAVKRSKEDRCHWNELDACSAEGRTILQNNPIPQNEEEIDKQCSSLKEAIACATNYTNKCATPLYRQLLAYGTDESNENINNFCTPGNELRTTLLKHASCLREVWSDQQACANDARAAIDKISTVPAKDRITLSCCSYRRFRNCGTEFVEKKCGTEAKDFIMKFVSFFAGNFPDILCQNFSPEDDKCKALLPPVGTQPKADSDSPLTELINLFSKN
ncbi:uncharacterized protein [Centruroides vittatus]|uniref:uncharacterized protein n=1 Tax=Centruroides vittatus TaxID=120091 RepID=UPI00350F454B